LPTSEKSFSCGRRKKDEGGLSLPQKVNILLSILIPKMSDFVLACKHETKLAGNHTAISPSCDNSNKSHGDLRVSAIQKAQSQWLTAKSSFRRRRRQLIFLVRRRHRGVKLKC
jgi:hypothetical protein